MIVSEGAEWVRITQDHREDTADGCLERKWREHVEEVRGAGEVRQFDSALN
jgi:hypothetical protein